jgi:acyl-CoA thioesterase II
MCQNNHYRLLAWFKVNSGYTHQDHQNNHRAILSFASDLFMAQCLLNVYPNVKLSKATSLDHSIWFHTDCNAQDWHLFVIECDHCKGGRALNSLR